jgi:hypothetical protein
LAGVIRRSLSDSTHNIHLAVPVVGGYHAAKVIKPPIN